MDSTRFRLIQGEIWSNTDKDASFCHADKIKPAVHEIPYVASGTQKWNGDSLSFIFLFAAFFIVLDTLRV